jgi:DnaK suppressor protein
VEEALARLSGGRYGLCETCGAVIPARRLAAAPEGRYCPRCETDAPPPSRIRLPATAGAG